MIEIVLSLPLSVVTVSTICLRQFGSVIRTCHESLTRIQHRKQTTKGRAPSYPNCMCIAAHTRARQAARQAAESGDFGPGQRVSGRMSQHGIPPEESNGEGGPSAAGGGHVKSEERVVPKAKPGVWRAQGSHLAAVSAVHERPRHDRRPSQGGVGVDATDQCWWCEGGRQSREHLFKECPT